LVERCPSCPYRKGRVCGPDGRVDSAVVIIGEAPGREELAANRPFVGKSGKLLDAVLAKAGIDRADAFVTNALRCQPTESPPSRAAIEACRERLTEEVLAYPRKVILALGNTAARGFLGDHNFKITSKRGQVIDLDEIGLFIPTFHPASILRNQGEYPRWAEDIKYAGQLLAGGLDALKNPGKPTAWVLLESPDEGNWNEKIIDGSQLKGWPARRVVTGIPAAVRAINMLLEMPVLSADIETGYSYSPRAGKVLALAVSWTPTDAVVFSEGLLNSKAFRPHLVRLLTSPGPLWVGHNIKYDTGFLQEQIIGCQQHPLAHSRSESQGTKPLVLPEEQSTPGCLQQGVLQDASWSSDSGPEEAQLRNNSGAVQQNTQGPKRALRNLSNDRARRRRRLASGSHSTAQEDSHSRHSVHELQPRVGKVQGQPQAAREGSGILGKYHCTLLEHYTLDESKGTHALEDLARDLLGAEDYKYVVRKYAKGDLGYENVPREILYPYCALDTSHTFALHQILCPKVHASPSLTRLYEHLLLPASRFLQKVQDYGLWVDQEFIKELDVELSARVAKAKADLIREVEPIWDTDEYMASRWATKKRPEGYNARNWRHTSFLLYKLIGWAPMNTNERTLRDLDQTGRDQSAIFGYKAKNYARGHPDRKTKLNYPYIQALIDVRMAQRAYDILVKRIWKDIEPDGRLHTTFNLQATETGRLSSTNPNLQNLPVPEKDDPKPARNIVGAPPGRVIMEADYCLAPETRVLRADLTWVPISSVRKGDELIGFDEPAHPLAYYRSSVVEKTRRLTQRCYKVQTSAGEIVASELHGWLKASIFGAQQASRRWMQTKDLEPGDQLVYLVDPWETDESREGGYIAGFLDSEGWCSAEGTKAQGVGFGQKAGVVQDRVMKKLHADNFNVVHYPYTNGVINSRFAGPAEHLKALGRYRPTRLLEKSRSLWEGRRTVAKGMKYPTVLAVEYLGEQEVVAVQTSTKTFIAEGFLTHNSQIELRLLAHFSDDDFLLGVYRDGRDLHTEVSIAIWGPGFTNYQRVRAKAVNFGIAYGRGAGSIAAEFNIPEEEAEEMRQAWFARAPKAAAWLDKLHQAPFTGRTVISPFGRRRRFGVVSRENYYELKNQSANFPMQSTATDLTLYSAIRAQEQWDQEGTDAHVICLVHDAVVVECPEEIADCVAAELTAVMEDVPQRILRPKIGFPVDVHIGRSWGTLKLGEMTGAQKVGKT
jgi:uracil-DNA glycosylase family 4